jgi:hypothetical protein
MTYSLLWTKLEWFNMPVIVMTYSLLWTKIEWLNMPVIVMTYSLLWTDMPVNGFILKNSVLFGTRSFKNLWPIVCFLKLIILEFNHALETQARKCMHLNTVLKINKNVIFLNTSIFYVLRTYYVCTSKQTNP